jgi:hypothetical protein
MKKFYVLTTNPLAKKPFIEVTSLEAKDEEQAWEILDGSCHNFDNHFLVTEEELELLHEKIESILKEREQILKEQADAEIEMSSEAE